MLVNYLKKKTNTNTIKTLDNINKNENNNIYETTLIHCITYIHQ